MKPEKRIQVSDTAFVKITQVKCEDTRHHEKYDNKDICYRGGEVAPELKDLAKEQGREFFDGYPQDNYPDVLQDVRAEMKELGWDTGKDDEELFEFAMHPEQYRAFKSGDAKMKFEADLAERKSAQSAPASVAPETAAVPAAIFA